MYMAIAPVCLRLESSDGAAEEYRVRDGRVEIREPQDNPADDDCHWHRLTPDEVSDHVNRNSAVAQWLIRRLGWRRLLRACFNEQQLRYLDIIDSTVERRAA